MPNIGGPWVMERSCGADFEDSAACPKANRGKEKTIRIDDFFIWLFLQF
jgi:hypothetical protein